jgi:hypothetical protein
MAELSGLPHGRGSPALQRRLYGLGGRTIADFAKLVEIFDQHQVSFVSITGARRAPLSASPPDSRGWCGAISRQTR